MKIITDISRILVGALFVVSGLIKANDPIGFSYKLGEYFAPDVLNWTIFEPFALQLAIFICVVEIVIGFATLFGAKMKLVSWSLLGMIVFFTFLTFYSAYFNKVTDCGCFGDALKLTPWESFYKDVVLLVLVLIIFIRQSKIQMQGLTHDLMIGFGGLLFVLYFSNMLINWSFPIYFYLVTFAILLVYKLFAKSTQKAWIMGLLAALISSYFTYHCVNHLPLKDFRPFAIGKSIPEGRTLPIGAKEDVYQTTMQYKNRQTGEVKDFTMQNYPWKDTLTWEFVDRITTLVEEGDHPPIHDFNLFDADGNDITEDLLVEPYMFLLVNYDISKASSSDLSSLNALVKDVYGWGYYMYGLTASNIDLINAYKKENALDFDFLTADETVLKTIIRSNPGLVMLKAGTVVGKWHLNDFPSSEEVKKIAQS